MLDTESFSMESWQSLMQAGSLLQAWGSRALVLVVEASGLY